jgi:dolichyl-phosphate beta-glucosyltransferase
MIYLSVIVPAYNEERRIAATLERIYKFLATKDYDFEIIMVDDGSTDGTVAVAEKSRCATDHKLAILKNVINRGKGASVRNGIAASSGKYVVFSDADLSTPIEELDGFIDMMDKGCDVVIGSRASAGSRVVVRQPFYRQTMGKVFNLLVKAILLKGLNDTQCGFKLFRGVVAREIAGEMKIEGFCFDVEMLYLARIKGYNIREKGVMWKNSVDSKVRLVNSSVSMFADLLRIRMLHSKKSIKKVSK